MLPAASSYYLSIIGNYFLLGHHSTFSVPRIHSYYSIKTIPRDTLVSSRGLKQNMVKKKKTKNKTDSKKESATLLLSFRSGGIFK